MILCVEFFVFVLFWNWGWADGWEGGMGFVILRPGLGDFPVAPR